MPSLLTGSVQSIHDLTLCDKTQMRALMERCYQNVTEEAFAQDLAEKESVILLRSEDGEIQGFSTLMRWQSEVNGQPITTFFSGDTIIAPDYWGETVLPRLWAKHVFGEAAKVEHPTYWFLISSGYKTYRFLPVFFSEFYPTYRAPTPTDIQGVLDAVARDKFAEAYDPTHGVIRLPHATPLRPDVADVEARRQRDPHVTFFLERNAGWGEGDELACITRVHPDNLTPAGRRMLYT